MSKQKFHLPKELKAPSEEFLSASKQIGLFWWHWDQREQKIQVVPELLRKLGIKPEEFDNRMESLYEKVHPDDIPKNRERYEALISGATEMYEIEYRVKDPKGGWKWYYNRGVVNERDESGQPVNIGGITIDISGEFQHLLTMVEEKDKFEFIFRNSTEAALIFELREDRIERIRDANQAALDLFGLQKEDFQQSFPAQYSTPEIKEVERKILQQISEVGYARFEQRVTLRNKSRRWLEVTAYSFSLTDQDMMLAIVSDKTSSRKTEAALRETEKLYRILFEAANDRIGLFTTEGKPILMNKAFYQTIGYTREEFMNIDSHQTVHPEDKQRIYDERQELLTKGNSLLEYRVRHKDGHYLHMSSKSVVIPGEQDGESLVLFIIRDISDRKKFIHELETAKLAAEESNKLKSAFLANMSHEIRTPMNSIVGFSNLLASEDLEEGVRKTYVERIVRNSELLLALISDIVDLAKIESGQLPLIYGKLKVSELMEELKQYAEEEMERYRNKHIDVLIQQEGKDVELETDVIRINQIMKNLINNAIKFTEQGAVTVGVKSDSKANRIVFHVRDTGIGIDSDHFGLIFEQFRQVDGSDTRKFGGTGLGLTICRKLVELLNGRIWVESASGEGAVFQVEMPLKHSGIIRQGAPDASDPASDSSVDGELFVMVVDDEPDSAALMEELITSMGHRVVKSYNGYEALQNLERGSLPDIVMMDVEMSVLSGTDVLRIMQERYPQIRVVAQSAHALQGDRKRFLDAGFDEYLPKPFSKQQLSEVLHVLSLP
jgi:PAS domain S-box-containing protein